MPHGRSSRIRSFLVVAPLCAVMAAAVISPGTSRASVAFVTEDGSPNLEALDLTTGAVTKTIPLGGEVFEGGAAFTPNGKFAYVPITVGLSLEEPPGVVDVINTKTAQVVSRITVGYIPSGITISPNGRYAYVRNHVETSGVGEGPPLLTEEGEYWSTISIIDTKTNRVVARPAVPEGYGAVIFSPDGRYAYLPDAQIRIDTESKKVVWDREPGSDLPGFSLPDSADPITAVFGASPKLAYFLTNTGLTALNTTTMKVAYTVPVFEIARQQIPYFSEEFCLRIGCLAISPDGAYTYLASGHTHTGFYEEVFEPLASASGASGRGVNEDIVSVISNSTHKVVANIPYGNGRAEAPALSVSSDGAYLYVSDAVNHDIHVINTDTRSVSATWPLALPQSLAVEPPARKCGASFVDTLKCAYNKGKDILSCGLSVAELFPALRGIKIITGFYKVRSFSKSLQPIYRLYNSVMRLKFRNGLTGADMWKAMQKGDSIADLIERVAAAIQSGVDIHNAQFKQFAHDLAVIWGVDGCLAPFEDSD